MYVQLLFLHARTININVDERIEQELSDTRTNTRKTKAKNNRDRSMSVERARKEIIPTQSDSEEEGLSVDNSEFLDHCQRLKDGQEKVQTGKRISKLGAAKRKEVNAAINEIDQAVKDFIQIINFQIKELSLVKNELITLLVVIRDSDGTDRR